IDTYEKLKQYKIKLVPFKQEYPFTKKLSIPYDVLFEKLPKIISVKYLRYILYYLYLFKYGSKYSKVMITDIKDVIFQRNPFDFVFNGGLYCFLENNRSTIKTSPFNSGRILRHFGTEVLEEIGDNHPSCSGTTFGSVLDLMDYLKGMIDLITKIDTKGGGDQGLHNYLVYSGKLKNLKFIEDNKGSVLTIGSKLNREIHFNKAGLVINADGEVFNTIHQYDRHPELFERFLKKYKLKLPMKFYLKYLWRWKNRFEDRLGGDFFNQLGWKIINLLKWKIK
ncbi:MAG: hypothetical protein ACFFD2_15185, partial [Promethearchaeota archaeon]